MTHGLPFFTRDMIELGSVPGWSSDFDAWAADALARGDVDELAAFKSRAPGMPYAHPTPDHFLPLFVTLGASGDPEGPVKTAIDGRGPRRRSPRTAAGEDRPHRSWHARRSRRAELATQVKAETP